MEHMDKIKIFVALVGSTFTEDFARGTALIVIVGAIAYMAIMREAIDAGFMSIAGLIVGYFFGRTVSNGQANTRDASNK